MSQTSHPNRQHPNRPTLVPELSHGSQDSKEGLTELKPNSPTSPADSSELPHASLNILPPPEISGLSPSALDPEDFGVETLTGKNLQRATKLSGLYATVGMIVAQVNLYDGLVLAKSAGDRATEVIKVARHHPAMMKIIDMVLSSNDYVTLAIGHGTLLMAILMNHERIPVNEALLQSGGFHPSQVFPPPEPTPPSPPPTAKKRVRAKKDATAVSA